MMTELCQSSSWIRNARKETINAVFIMRKLQEEYRTKVKKLSCGH